MLKRRQDGPPKFPIFLMIPGATPIKDFLFSFLMRSRHGIHTRLRTNDHMHARRLADTLHTREPTHVAHTHTRTHTHTHTHLRVFFLRRVGNA